MQRSSKDRVVVIEMLSRSSAISVGTGQFIYDPKTCYGDPWIEETVSWGEWLFAEIRKNMAKEKQKEGPPDDGPST